MAHCKKKSLSLDGGNISIFFMIGSFSRFFGVSVASEKNRFSIVNNALF
jgi:hypothetical protein